MVLRRRIERRDQRLVVRFTASLAAAGCLLGCSGGPSRVKPPSIDADDAASAAVELYDKDADGKIAGSELDAAAPLKAALATIDANKDGAVEENEIYERIRAWQAHRIGIMAVNATCTLDGRPLVGAQVTFEPEPYLGDDIKAGSGETSAAGTAMPTIPKEDRPTKDTPPGLQIGLYRVRVSKMVDGKETLPAKYNAETTLGQQISPDDPAIAGQKMRFTLTTK